ncbi:NAD kinase [Chengkuizengella sediminis]|uniref:NAD kinase n=1 Tax=Chengkuizengella sediminis TaxID=1885917 RepID=UPI00138A0361|nr:NAD kinase [Chengkuizengella sediminis]NDI36745.1 NAD kinase [Chengkuizengella sediminis]
MKYFVLDRGDETSLKLSDKFHKLAKQHNMILDEFSPDIVISIGGDGTMLYAFHKFVQQLETISFVGIHTGHLGFYADWKPDEIEHLLEIMAKKANSDDVIVEYPIVQIEIKTVNDTRIYYALNEITIKGIHATLVAQLDINDDKFEMFRGDGICISTPSGSTAYNKGLGGGIIHPSLAAIQIAEMASINNRVFRTLGSPIILPKHHHCDIYPKANQKILLSVDHLQFEHKDIISIRSSVSHKKVRFARYRTFPFWNRVKEAFVGNDLN